MSQNVLHVENVTMQFGGVVAVNNLSMDINEGEIVALIGPNGAGKTTAFNCITGVYEPTNGRVDFLGATIVENYPTGKMKRAYAGQNDGKYTRKVVHTPDKITKLGIARTFQNIRLFKNQTVFNNVLIAMHMRRTSNVFTATFRLNLREEQRRLEIARALATHPKLLLLDEPAAGMNPQETEELGEFIKEIKEKFKLTVFMIEHHMNLVMGISDRIYVIDFGKQIAEGTPKEVRDNPAVIAAYLGVDEE